MLLRGARFEQLGSLALAVLVAACSQAPGTTTETTTGNRAPAISGTPSTTVAQGAAYQFSPSASDPDGDPLTFGVDAKPAWGVFDTSTGRLSGTPSASDVGVARGIVISVSDGHSQTALPAFDITVSAQPSGTNQPPTISGSPPTTASVGTAYTFTPTASDPDAGTTLTFSIANKPAWATFSTTTGQLQGTPTAAGTFAGIAISVSDGQAAVALSAFSVIVQAVATGSATLTWTPPTQNTDGSPLTDLAGYKIYWGTSQGSYSNSVTLNNPGLASYVVTNLVSGTYYFVATAINSQGVESSYSAPASKTIP
jgi:hypothetical protein